LCFNIHTCYKFPSKSLHHHQDGTLNFKKLFNFGVGVGVGFGVGLGVGVYIFYFS